ncbi:MAG: Uma2 family endonuclease [Drouetiella hepatica Uher 2000/2452]|uniref:Uma2 family endonuclease n=1 Tax=Drouetiella hepatica Uher 2000/2452 TaxID=904376 RepID=A0A951Q9I2_9CYAN|nr:Uma2 family endonuclease [Drouetiella hepatica Uher 2000/2452]
MTLPMTLVMFAALRQPTIIDVKVLSSFSAPSPFTEVSMVAGQKKFHISAEEYLVGERVSPIKHEYRQGHVYAMMGAKKPHLVLASNLVMLLGNHLSATPCLVFTSDIKVRLEATDCYYYPDVAVTCDERELNGNEDFILYPSFVIEILSSSTAAFDRGEKFADYQTCPTLKEYVLVDQIQMQVECYRLSSVGDWIGQTYLAGEEISFSSLDFHCPIAHLYQKVPGLL